MSKKILAVFFLIIILAIGGQFAFWFFKTSQLERQLTKYSAGKDSLVLVNKFEISGFPLNQNVTIHNLKIKLPESIAKKSELIFKRVELSSSIFSDIFEAKLSENVVFSHNGTQSDVEFDQPPVSVLRINSQGVSKLTYSDKGYRVFGADKNLLTRSGPNNIEIIVKENESGQIISRIKSSSKNTETFDILSFYKNHYEEKIIDGIKTGKIKIGMKELEQEEQASQSPDDNMKKLEEFNESVALDQAKPIQQQDLSEKPNTSETENIAEVKKVGQPAIINNDAEQNLVESIKEASKKTESLAKNSTNDSTETSEEISQEELAPGDENIASNENVETIEDLAMNVDENIIDVVDNNMPSDISDTSKNNEETSMNAKLDSIEDKIVEVEEVLKNDVIVDVEYILSPIKSESVDSMTDPTKIAQTTIHYDKSYKINKFEISNDKFTINVNGQLDRPRDDTGISGFVTLKIDSVEKFIDFVKSSFAKIAEKNDSQIKSFDPSYSSAIVENAYSSFLSVVSERLTEIMTEVAEKNQLSQNESMVFDIRREKNLDIVINETPIREIVGKF